MVDFVRERQQQLKEWLEELVCQIRTQGGSTWDHFVLAVSDKSALIELDGIPLQLQAHGGEPLQVEIEPIRRGEGTSTLQYDFRSDAETLRAIIQGKLSLDAAVVRGQIYVQGTLSDLTAIYGVVMNLFADSAIHPELQDLWNKFDEIWLLTSVSPIPATLEQQHPAYGYLIENIPEDVLRVSLK
ncbi:hypothetical protein [Planktothrix pseudagardhii]|uniref:SCP2 domain-containing protein n=1 Tax=Planktothrix pseudagardhii TaxID=132604 RepID=A0A9W4CFS9_9CYAN|nr:hypothetical protein [Planktothrix pseudagardhii]CAD5925043.1 hypothetical protein NO713_00915 [Planktothrix pseudagardhii]